MDKTCTSCGKAVYSMELLRCMDQTWHKTCFKCQTCGMTLNVKNYKAFDKKPYCNAHYPQSKAYTFVTDNQEIQRVKQNTAVISAVSYTGRKASAVSSGTAPIAVINRRFSETPSPPVQQQQQQQSSYQPGSISDFDPEAHDTADRGLDPKAGRRGSTIFSSSALVSRSESRSEATALQAASKTDNVDQSALASTPEEMPQAPQSVPEVESSEVSKPQLQTSEVEPEVVQQPQSAAPEAKPEVPQPQPAVPEAKPEVPQPQPAVPEAKYEEVPELKPAAPEAKPEVVQQPPPEAPEAKPEEVPQPQQLQQIVISAPVIVAKPTVSVNRNRGRCYRALFSYTAQDSDEVTFNEGDVIINGDPIDAGWMYGIVERTGQYGMLPANYVLEEAA